PEDATKPAPRSVASSVPDDDRCGMMVEMRSGRRAPCGWRPGWSEEGTMKRLVGIALMVAGCSGAPSPVPVVGTPAGLGKRAGEWSGEYQGTGRSGSIVFKLAAGADNAAGDVVMITNQRREQRLPSQDPSAGLPIARTPEVLAIEFVRAAGGGVSGRLHPY